MTSLQHWHLLRSSATYMALCNVLNYGPTAARAGYDVFLRQTPLFADFPGIYATAAIVAALDFDFRPDHDRPGTPDPALR